MKNLCMMLSLVFLIGCQNPKDQTKQEIDINKIKSKFIKKICSSSLLEAPFSIDYRFKTMFFSKEIVSFLGHLSVFEALPHNWERYETATYFVTQDELKEIHLLDIFSTKKQQSWLVKFCEDFLRDHSCSYFSGNDPLKKKLEIHDFKEFFITDSDLIILFQQYSVGGLIDGPFHIKIPIALLNQQWKGLHSLITRVDSIVRSQKYIVGNADFLSL